MIENVITNLESVIIFIAVLSVLIIVHEWGHFITAKSLGVDVERFALGFGPKLFSKVYHGTTYMINAIPLGGYVKMAGDERAECQGKPGEFYSKPVGHRSLVVVNGPVVNFILAYFSFFLVFMIGYPGQSTIIWNLEKGGPAEIAGLQPGDKIVALDSKGVYGWLNLESRLEGSKPGPVNVTVLRGGEKMTKPVVPRIEAKPNIIGKSRMVRDLGVDNLPNIIGGLIENYPSEQSGLQGGDRIIEIDGKMVTSWSDVKDAVAHSTGRQIVLKIVREGKVHVKAVTPKIDWVENENGQKVEERKIGIGPQQELDLFRFGFIDSLANSVEELAYVIKLTCASFWGIVTRTVSAKESVTGPVGIFYIIKGAAEEGISHLLFILGVISASLAIFNLLPVIPLDGGHLFLFLIEKVRGKALPAKIDEYIARVGFGLIVVLALFVFYNDFVRFGWMENIGSWLGHIRKMFP